MPSFHRLGPVVLALLLPMCSGGLPHPAPGASVTAPSGAGLASRAADAGPTDGSPVEDASPAAPPPVTFLDLSPTRRQKPDRPGDFCQPADENIERAERELTSKARAPGTAVGSTPWDKRRPPAALERIARRFALTRAERALLAKNGFVVSERLEQTSFADAFHEIYQSELPLYVSVDAIFHAVQKTNERTLEEAESRLAVRLEGLVRALRSKLSQVARDYPREVAKDLDVYLTIADSLLAGEKKRASFGTDGDVDALLEKVTGERGGLEEVALFGRRRMIDFSQFQPRGHYAKSEPSSRYFRAAMWLSRVELNLVSRSSRSSEPGFVPNPAETPREAVDALALADLVERSGALGDLDVVERAWSLLAGRREDVSVRDLLALEKRAKIGKLEIPGSAEALRAAIGSGFARTARIHYMPQGSTSLPVIATLLGPRIGPDSAALTHLVHAEVPDRDLPRAADVAYLLGHERARTLLAKDLRRYPGLEQKLGEGRRALAAAQPSDLYSAWLVAIRELAAPVQGAVPSFMKTEAFADLRLGSTIAAYAGLRHDYVLMAGETYSEGGCEIPDGFVEPAPAVYRALRAYADRGVEALHALGDARGEERFRRLGRVLEVLATISDDELAGRPISEAVRNYLSMVVEIVPPSSDGPGSFNGWYFDLFPSIDAAFEEHALIADWFTGSSTGTVLYAGITRPRLGVFVVDVGGAARAFVGPVARSFEHVGALTKRAKDADVARLPGLRDAWAHGYTASAPKAPALSILPIGQRDDGGQIWAVRSPAAARTVSIELLGHHREVIGTLTRSVGAAFAPLSVPRREGDDFPERVRLRAGEFSAEVSAWALYGEHTFGGVRPLDDERAEATRSRLLAAEPRRPE